MVQPNGVTDPASQTGAETDDRGVPIKNLQAEFARKLEDIKGEVAQKFDALAQKLDSLTRVEEPEPVTSTGSINEREELVKISARPRGYVEDVVKPYADKVAKLEQEAEALRKATLTSQWERMEDRIARAEGKKDWNELPDDFRKEVRQEIVNRGWAQSPAAAMDAYDIVRARKTNSNASDPDRRRRIDGQSEGSGQRTSVSSAQTLSRSMVSELSTTPPSHPDYKKNMETLDKVQKGQIRVEG